MIRFKRSRVLLFAFLLILGGLILSHSAATGENLTKVKIIQLDDATINPVTADYIIAAIDQSFEENAQCLIIKLDTPGGLLSSTRLIVKNMLSARIPVVVYIAPSGSRAGSAGVFITYASHIAAMAPSTNIGAAHPVELGGEAPGPSDDWKELRRMIEELQEFKKTQEIQSQEISTKEEKKKKKSDKAQEAVESISEEKEKIVSEEYVPDDNPMRSKILQDTIAFIRAIATERNRNIEWGITSVTKSSSITDEEAIEKGVVEIIAKNDQDLLDQLDGRVVMINGREVTLETKGAVIETIKMDFRQRFFNTLANPNIAYFLMILGFYGLLFEITHPGIGVPGVLGAIFLILAFYSMQTLPTNYAGLALLILGLLLLIAEAYVPGFGLLTLGGVVCMVLGSMLLFDSPDPLMRVSKSIIFGFSLATAGITLFLVRSVIRSHRAKVQGGKEGLIGETGEAQTTLTPGKKGKVFVHGEIWTARSDETIKKGDEVVITAINRLILTVKPK